MESPEKKKLTNGIELEQGRALQRSMDATLGGDTTPSVGPGEQLPAKRGSSRDDVPVVSARPSG